MTKSKASAKLEQVLASFKINGEVVGVDRGPVVTTYKFEPQSGIRVNRIVLLELDIARSMKAASARVSLIPNDSALAIELPNEKPATVDFDMLLLSPEFMNATEKLPMIMGRDVFGEPVIADLAAMPHLLVAGTTGSGKSVWLNAVLLSLLSKFEPSECKLILIDPKMLEFSDYRDIPHLLTPVITDPQEAVEALGFAVEEMECRYAMMAEAGVRNIAELDGQLPYLVIIVDEFADLMLTSGGMVEHHIQRLAQKARAAGIHVILTTQRPSVDVVTGTIKANFPARIAFKVVNKGNSRIILDYAGAEQLIGRGDMLFLKGSNLQRIHGPYVTNEQIEDMCNLLRASGQPEYKEVVNEQVEPPTELLELARRVIDNGGVKSTSYLQRQLLISEDMAQALVERLS